MLQKNKNTYFPIYFDNRKIMRSLCVYYLSANKGGTAFYRTNNLVFSPLREAYNGTCHLRSDCNSNF